MSIDRHPPAFCPVHGLFPFKGVRLGENASGAIFVGNVTTCPRCGQQCEIVPGVYDPTADGLNILLDTSISPEALAALRNIAERAQSGEISADQAKAEAARVSPKAAALFDVANWSDQARATLYGAIIGAVAIVGAARLASTTTQIVVQPVIERIVERPEAISPKMPAVTLEIPTPRPRPKQPKE